MTTAFDDQATGIRPQAGPQSILLAAADIEEVFFGGALAAGKTYALALDFERHHQQNGKITGIAFRMSIPELDDMISKFKDVLEPFDFEYKVGKKEFRHPDGTILRMRHLEDAKDTRLYWGHEYQWMAVDELGDMPEATCLAIQKLRAARLRSAKGQKIRFVGTGNPCGAGHTYCKSRYIDPANAFTPFKNPTSGHSMIFIPGRLENNLLMLQNDPNYAKRCEDLGPKWYVDALLLGDWSKSVDGNMFHREWFKNRYRELPKLDYLVVSWDTAFKKTKDSARSAATVWGLTKDAFYIIDAWAGKVEFPELKRKSIDLWQKHHSNDNWVEDKASGQSLVPSLKEDTRMPVKGIKVDGDKQRRAFAVTPLFESEKIFLPEFAPWVHDYIEEMVAFPTPTGYSDYVDSTSQALTELVKIKKRLERLNRKVVPFTGSVWSV